MLPSFMIVNKKQINRKKPYVPGDDDWSRYEQTVGEKISPGEIVDVPDRAITFHRNKYAKTKEDDYNDKTEEFKDGFGNTAQYLKFVNAYLTEKKNHLDKFLAEKDRFDDDIAALNPDQMSKEHLDKINYKNVKAADVKKVLEHVEGERESIKEKIDYFYSQIDHEKKELAKKNKHIDEIKSEISFEKKSRSSNEFKIEKENDPIETIQKELRSVASKNGAEKIFGAINSLVVLLNSKNQATLNELSAVKNEFNKMKQEYDRVMNNLEKKKGKK